MVEILTLNRNYEGIVRGMELERSSKETLDYVAHLTWIQVLKSNWLRKSVLKRFGTFPKFVFTILSKDEFQYIWFMHIYGISNSSATFSPNPVSF